MPKTNYVGVKNCEKHNFFETKVTFKKIYNNPIINNLCKPLMQGALNNDKVLEMKEEYKQHSNYLNFKNHIVIADLHNTFYIVDGQHRLEMARLLYEENNDINDYLYFCWYKCKNEKDMRNLFNSINKDSCKNKFYVNQDDFKQVKINEFTKLLKENYKTHFSKKQSTSSKIMTIEEFRNYLINIKYFDNNLTPQALYNNIVKKNEEFFIENRYSINFENNKSNYYIEEQKNIEKKVIMSLKNANFINWLQDSTNNPAKHILRKGKKRINRNLRLQVWNKEFDKNQQSGLCPINNCSVILIKESEQKSNWDCGHVISEFNGGETNLGNLRPICKKCNNSMGKTNWDIYENDLLL